MNFQLRPQVYSLLLCSSLEENPQTNGWIVQPFSEISVQEMPVDLALTVFAQIMAPPGSYEMLMRFYHAADPGGTIRALAPRQVHVQEGKNLDFVLHLEVTITQLGLHLLDASLEGGPTAVSPLRIALG